MESHLEDLGYSCAPDCSDPQRPGQPSEEGHVDGGQGYEYAPPADLTYAPDYQVDVYQETYAAYEDSEGMWTEPSSYISEPITDVPVIKAEEVPGPDNHHPFPDNAEAPNVGFHVKRIGRAVLDFRSALRGALRKLDAAAPGDESEAILHAVEPATLPGAEPQRDQVCEETTQGNVENVVDGLDTAEESNQSKAPSPTSSEQCHVQPPPEEIIDDHLPKEAVVTYEPQPCPEEPLSCLDPAPSTTALSPPSDEGPANTPMDPPVTTPLSQCTTAESLVFSCSAEDSAPQEEIGRAHV